MTKTVLVIDDENSIRSSLAGALGDEGYQVKTASSGQEGIEMAASFRPDVILLDIWMPEMDGIETLKKIKDASPTQPVIMMSGHGTIETAVKATKIGAYDFVEKPLSLEKILVLVQNACKMADLTRQNEALRQQVHEQRSLVGKSLAIRQIKEIIQKVAPTTGSVLITGENGTGKELVAHEIHALSDRFNKPFIEVNCAAIPEELIESELFGHEKGSFTGATQMRRGKFDLAHEGTLFLDEIGDMSLKTQAKILRILQEQKFERVGGTQTTSVDVRIIAATNKDLKEEIKNGQFREDLFYRLNVIPFHVPPLRERKEDIRILAEHFLQVAQVSHKKKGISFRDSAFSLLESYAWPGNVRELKNLVERLVILSADQQVIDEKALFDHLGVDSTHSTHGSADIRSDENAENVKNLRDARSQFEKDFIYKRLVDNKWNISKTAHELGIERSYLHRKIKSYGIEE